VEILEDEHHIEVLQTELNTLEMSNFNVLESDDNKWWFCKLDQAVC
jgi:hypothetical protein